MWLGQTFSRFFGIENMHSENAQTSRSSSSCENNAQPNGIPELRIRFLKHHKFSALLENCWAKRETKFCSPLSLRKSWSAIEIYSHSFFICLAWTRLFRNSNQYNSASKTYSQFINFQLINWKPHENYFWNHISSTLFTKHFIQSFSTLDTFFHFFKNLFAFFHELRWMASNIFLQLC